MFKIMSLVILCDVFLNPSFKITTSFANVDRTTASLSKFHTRKNFKSSGMDLYIKNNF